MDPERADEARLILIWGSNPIVSNLHFWTRCQEAKRRGAKLVAIDPWRSQTAEKCHQHVQVLPGTDAALALGMMHVIIGEQLYDRDYVERHTLGFERAGRARAGSIPPEHVARICGIEPQTVIELAREYAAHEAGGDPAQLRHAAPRRRRHGGADHRLPAGAGRRVARRRRRRAALDRRLLRAWTTRRSSART